MGRTRTSSIWLMDACRFAEIISTSKTTTEALSFFGLKNIGSNNRTIWGRIKELNLDTSHLTTLREWRNSRNWSAPAASLESVMVRNSGYSRAALKKRLLRDGILEKKCAICGMPPEWNGKPLVLRLDHENGVRDDNRLSNLRLLCPNCDSQLDTFCGRMARTKPTPKCVSCGVNRTKYKGAIGRRCALCAGKKLERATWPSDNYLVSAQETNVAIGARLGVSETAVRKRIKRILANRLKVGLGSLKA